MAKKKEEKKVEMTRAQKTEATKSIIKELLAVKPMKHNELIEETAKLYTERYKSEETENVNDVKGRAGSVLDIMKKESEIMYEGGMYALKARIPAPAPVETAEEKPKKTAKTKAKTANKKEEVKEEAAPKKRGRKPKTTEEGTPTSTVTKEAKEPAPVSVAEKTEEPAPKKRGRKPKAKAEELSLTQQPALVEQEPTPAAAKEPAPAVAQVEKTEEPTPTAVEEPTPAVVEAKTEEKAEEATPTVVAEEKKEATALTVKPKAEIAQKGVVMDMSFLIGNVKEKSLKAENKPQKREEAKVEAKTEKQAPMSATKTETPTKAEEKKEVKAEEKPTQKPTPKPVQKAEPKTAKPAPKQESKAKQKQPEKPMTADEKLREAFLKRMRSLGGDYFEYYSVYLLERYSMKNGRRLEGLKISGGDHDGGIDGEIELTDKFGFKETIYIQSKNWDPDKGKEEYWVVGETLLQQFIGACACKQAKDGKQYCRGIFITTSRFTPDAKRILDDMSDKIVGYDGNDLYETAKECAFGLTKKNGEWALDEKLLSGTKAFFSLY